MNHKKKIFTALSAMFLAGQIYSGSIQYKTGPNIIVNGNFELDRNKDGISDGWTRGVQMPGAKAEVVLERNVTGNCMRIKFFSADNMLQARVFQNMIITPGKIYELKYEYKSGIDSNFKADILMTGTGPIYRSIYNIPAKTWTTVRKLFLVPLWMKGPAAIYVQNRSTVPVWYRNISFRETDINPQKIKDYQPEVQIQPVSSEDQVIMPGTTRKEVEFLVRVKAPASLKSHFYAEAYLMTGKNKYLRCTIKEDKLSIPLNRISDGSSTINVLILDRKDKNLVAETSIGLEKVPASMIKGKIDLRTSVVFKDSSGKSFFPIGMYGLRINSSNNDFNVLKEAGFNTVHCYSFEGGKLDAKRVNNIKAFLDKAHQSGMKVLFGIPRSLAERAGKTSSLIVWLKNFKSHPAILFYYSDEMFSMRHTPMKTFKATREALRKVDAKRQWIIYDGIEASLAPNIDGIMSNIESTNKVKLIKLRLGNDIPYFTVFGQRDYKAAKAASVKDLRYNIFMPVIWGARGVFYWWYPTLAFHNQEKELLKKRLFSNIKILSQVAPALVSGEKSPAFTSAIKVSGDVRYCFGTLNGVTYILAGVEKSGKGGTLAFDIPGKMKVETFFNDKSSSHPEFNPGELELFKISAK